MLSEKYRPTELENIIGQDEIIKKLISILERKSYPHMLFVGRAGIGKTTTAHAFAKRLFGEGYENNIAEFNASDERGINVVRSKIKNVSKILGQRIIFLDEVDNMTSDAQAALRRTMETCAETIFILAANKEFKIIEPIRSRCAIFRFKKVSDDDIKKRLFDICNQEKITFPVEDDDERQSIKDGIDYLIEKSNGDMRQVLNTFESLLSKHKTISIEEIITLQKPSIVSNAIQTAIDGDFHKSRKLVEDAYIENGFGNFEGIIDEIYEYLGSLNTNIIKDEVKIRLYTRVAQLEVNCRDGNNPLYQIVEFLAYCWLYPHTIKSVFNIND